MKKRRRFSYSPDRRKNETICEAETMDPHVLKVFPKEVAEIFFDIKNIFENLPQEENVVRQSKTGLDRVISCHMICRALENFFPVECSDGYFMSKMNPHSWLVPKARWSVEPYFYERYIIDPYPCLAASGPIMVYNYVHSPWYKAYLEHDLEDVRDPDILHGDDVVKVSRLIEETAAKLGIALSSKDYLSQCFVSKKQIKYRPRKI